MDDRTHEGPQVFIAHATEDRDKAEGLRRKLESRGMACWLAERDSSGEFPDAIAKALSECRAVLLLFSEAAIESPWVKSEITVARGRGLPIVALRVEDIRPAGGYELLLAQFHWLDGFPDPLADDVVDRVARELLSVPGPGPGDVGDPGGPRHEPGPRRRWPTWVALGLVFVITIAVAGAIAASLRRTVPDLTAKARAEAEALVTDRGLRPQPTTRFDRVVGPGQVIPGSQTPAPGVRVWRGSQVAFAVSAENVPVPDLSGRTREDAENALKAAALVAQAHDRFAPGVVSGTVIPDTQDPGAGQEVRRGAAVHFDVAAIPSVEIIQPKSDSEVEARLGPDGEYRLIAQGSVTFVPDGMRLTAWTNPVNPPGDGWYLHARPVTPSADGAWEVGLQLGTARGGYPPHTGDTFSVAVVLVDDGEVPATSPDEASVVRDKLPDGPQASANGLRIRLAAR